MTATPSGTGEGMVRVKSSTARSAPHVRVPSKDMQRQCIVQTNVSIMSNEMTRDDAMG